jgi:hypothetical protein
MATTRAPSRARCAKPLWDGHAATRAIRASTTPRASPQRGWAATPISSASCGLIANGLGPNLGSSIAHPRPCGCHSAPGGKRPARGPRFRLLTWRASSREPTRTEYFGSSRGRFPTPEPGLGREPGRQFRQFELSIFGLPVVSIQPSGRRSFEIRLAAS